MLSDSDKSDSEGFKDANTVCVAHPLSWRCSPSGDADASPHVVPRGLPRSISNATTLPCGREAVHVPARVR
jgi:hypothetical protein